MAGFSLGGAVNSAADWACSAPVVRGIVGNPVFTALLITALVVVVAMAVYYRQIRRGGTRKAVKAVLYIFILVTAVTFVHHYAVARGARDAAAQKGMRDVFSSIQQSRESGIGAGTPVFPAGWAPPPAAATGGATGGGGGCDGPAGPRADNVAGAPFSIEDVVVPTLVSAPPTQRTAPAPATAEARARA